MDIFFVLEALVVLGAIVMGTRAGGVGVGLWGGLGVGILAVVTAASMMQALPLPNLMSSDGC